MAPRWQSPAPWPRPAARRSQSGPPCLRTSNRGLRIAARAEPARQHRAQFLAPHQRAALAIERHQYRRARPRRPGPPAMLSSRLPDAGAGVGVEGVPRLGDASRRNSTRTPGRGAQVSSRTATQVGPRVAAPDPLGALVWPPQSAWNRRHCRTAAEGQHAARRCAARPRRSAGRLAGSTRSGGRYTWQWVVAQRSKPSRA